MNPLPSGVEQESSGDDDYGDFAFVSGWGVLGLLVGPKSLGLYALIGVVLLMGIVTKNSILLLDYAIMNQQFGKPMYEATLEKGVARLRPILMTTIAMIAGMVPIALGIGAGKANSQPDDDGGNWRFDDF